MAAHGFVHDLRRLLRGRDFRRLFVTRLSSQAGDGAFQVGLASLFFFSPERAATATAAAIAFTVAVLPYTLVGPVAGVLLDLWPRRQVLLIANALRAVMVSGIAALVLAGRTGLILYAAVLACMSVNRFFLAGLGAALPHVVEPDELVMANSLSPTCGTVAMMAGGGLAYLLGRAVGDGDGSDAALLVLAAAWYATSACLAARMDRLLLGPDVAASGLPPGRRRGLTRMVRTGVATTVADVAAGARHLRDRPRAAHALAAIGAHKFAFGISTIATILLCRNYFNDPADADAGLALLATVAAAVGIGIGSAAVITPMIVRRIGPQRWIVSCLALAALTESVFIVTISARLVVAAGLVLGVAGQGVKICVDVIVQQSVDDEFRGRVFSFYDVVFNAAFVIAAAVAALTLPPQGFSPAVYATITAIYAVAAIGYRRASRRATAKAAAARAQVIPLGSPVVRPEVSPEVSEDVSAEKAGTGSSGSSSG